MQQDRRGFIAMRPVQQVTMVRAAGICVSVPMELIVTAPLELACVHRDI